MRQCPAAVHRVIGLQARPHAPRQPLRIAKGRADRDLARDTDQVLIAHELADRGHHFRRQARREGRKRCPVGFMMEQPVAQVAHRHMGNRRKGRGIVTVNNQPCDFIRLVRDRDFIKEGPERNVRQCLTRADPLQGIRGGNPGQFITGAIGRGIGKHLFQGGKAEFLSPQKSMI